MKILNGFYHKTGFVGECGRWWKKECSMLKRSSHDILEDWGLITFSCKVLKMKSYEMQPCSHDTRNMSY